MMHPENLFVLIDDGEFEWNVQPEVGLDPNWFQEYNESNGRSNPIFKIISRKGIFGSFFLAGIVMIVVGIAGLTISSSIPIGKSLGIFIIRSIVNLG